MPTPLKADEILRGRYRIKRIIGQGGMGSIYLADDLRLEGRLCALKEVEHDRSLSAELLKQAREQFLREATVLARYAQYCARTGRDAEATDAMRRALQLDKLNPLIHRAAGSIEFAARRYCQRENRPQRLWTNLEQGAGYRWHHGRRPG